ncbi:MAG: S41 family peptidase [Chlorobi bacterium]|nr:S41 family peptidase [Chlorobiota bacterium]
MKRKSLIIVLLFSFVFLTAFVKGDSDKYFEIAKSIDIFGRIFKEINRNYVDEIDVQEFMLAGIKGMLSSLDPYTVYLDKNLQKDFDIITKGKYGGIGATVGIQNGKVTVVDLIEGYSAQRQGIRIGDVIVKIDSYKVSKNNFSELGSYLKKKPGVQIKVTVEREGFSEPITFDLVAEEVEIKNVPYYGFVPKDGNNAYIKLSGFSRSAGEEVKNALLAMEKERDVKSIVLDLRGNPGGLLDAAIDVSDKFLKRGEIIVGVNGRDVRKNAIYKSVEKPVAGSRALAALIDGGSASASEIVAGALQDNDRAVIVGKNSFGKGLVQTVVPLSFNTSLKLTTAKYFTPSGRSIQKIDYSKDNKVFLQKKNDVKMKYKTLNGRPVFPSGGIMPDTIVASISEANIIKQLLTKGMFFKFATFYFNTHPEMSLENIDDASLFEKFKKYLKEHQFDYTSDSERLLKRLNKSLKSEGLAGKLEQDVQALLDKIKEEKSIAVEAHKSEITSEIKKEFAARIFGRAGRIEESLKTDKQFETALGIISNKAFYDKILNTGK